MQNEIIRPKQLQERVGISRTTAWSLMKEGEFPAPIQLGKRSIGWRSSDIEKWLKSRERQPATVVR